MDDSIMNPIKEREYPALRELAEKAALLDHNENDDWYTVEDIIDDVYYQKNACFIAATTPQVVLGLLDEIERLKAELIDYHHECSQVVDNFEKSDKELRATIERQRKVMQMALEAFREPYGSEAYIAITALQAELEKKE